MSILKDAFDKKITWEQAATQIEGYFKKILPVGSVSAIETNLKQAASNAIAAADTAMGPILSTGAVAVSVAVSTAFAKAGLIGVAGTPATLAAIASTRDALIAAIHEEATKAEASLTAAPVTAAPVP